MQAGRSRHCVGICGFFGRALKIVGRAMKRKYVAKIGAWSEEATSVANGPSVAASKDGVRVVKVMFPVENDAEEVDAAQPADDISDSFPNAIWPGECTQTRHGREKP